MDLKNTVKIICIAVSGIILSAQGDTALAFDIPDGTPTTTLTQNSSIENIRTELKSLTIPLIEISLKDGEFPTYDIITAPEGMSGTSVINNEYVEGSMSISLLGQVLYESGAYEPQTSGMRLRVRGNTSSASQSTKKKSYKIKLSKKANLLLPEINAGKTKDWILLGYSERRLNYLAGMAVARFCGMPWEPAGHHVNLIVNNKYMGLYLLTESIGAGSKRVALDASGYIIENDPYWWKPDEVYFRSNHDHHAMGWTFKEPDPDDFTEMSMGNIEWAVNTFEAAIYKDNNGEQTEDETSMQDDFNYNDCLDLESFTRWIMAHDIMNTIDSRGSNSYVIKYDFKPKTPFSTKFEAGPLWDFDSSFDTKSEDFAKIRTSNASFHSRLVILPEFNALYEKIWGSIRKDLSSYVLGVLEDYLTKNPDLYKARVIDVTLGMTSSALQYNPYANYLDLVDWFDTRVPVINNLVYGTPDPGDTEEISVDRQNGEISKSYDINGIETSADARGVKVNIHVNGAVSKTIK